MKILVEISGEPYDRLMSQCNPSSEEYALLKNGVVGLEGNGHNWRTIAIWCELSKRLAFWRLPRRSIP